MIDYVYLVDFYGNNINVVRVGKVIFMMVRIFFFRENEIEKEVSFICGEGMIVCNKLIGVR